MKWLLHCTFCRGSYVTGTTLLNNYLDMACYIILIKKLWFKIYGKWLSFVIILKLSYNWIWLIFLRHNKGKVMEEIKIKLFLWQDICTVTEVNPVKSKYSCQAWKLILWLHLHRIVFPLLTLVSGHMQFWLTSHKCPHVSHTRV